MQIVKTLNKSLLVFALLGCCLSAGGDPIDKRHAELIVSANEYGYADEESDIGTIVAGAMRPVTTQPGFTGVAIGVRRHAKDHFYFFGDRDSKGHGTPPDAKTLFMLGSITKTFTATQLALYVRKASSHSDNRSRRISPVSTKLHRPTTNHRSRSSSWPPM